MRRETHVWAVHPMSLMNFVDRVFEKIEIEHFRVQTPIGLTWENREGHIHLPAPREFELSRGTHPHGARDPCMRRPSYEFGEVLRSWGRENGPEAIWGRNSH